MVVVVVVILVGSNVNQWRGTERVDSRPLAPPVSHPRQHIYTYTIYTYHEDEQLVQPAVEHREALPLLPDGAQQQVGVVRVLGEGRERHPVEIVGQGLRVVFFGGGKGEGVI